MKSCQGKYSFLPRRGLKTAYSVVFSRSHSFGTSQTTSITSNPGFRAVFPRRSFQNYDDFYNNFEWKIPKYFNIGFECSDAHVARGCGNNNALIDHNHGKYYTFNDISKDSNSLANALSNQLNIESGDRIAILLPQSYETGISHLAAFKMNCISIPLFTLFGNDALAYRLSDSQTKCLITNEQCLPTILEIENSLPNLEYIICVSDTQSNKIETKSSKKTHIKFDELISNGDCELSFAIEKGMKASKSTDGALIIYTSGTTGDPKGCLHSHGVLLGHLPGIETPHNFFASGSNSVFWTPADWAWIGGLLDVLLPAWYYGIPTVAHRMRKFDVDESFELIKKYKITNTFLPPTSLKMMKSHTIDDNSKNETKILAEYENHGMKMDSIGSGGETLGEHLLEWGKELFDGLIMSEFYGQTECNLIVSNSPTVFDVKNGSMGRPVPGHNVKIIKLENDNDDKNDEKQRGTFAPNGESGVICVKEYIETKIGSGEIIRDPVMFVKYWNLAKKTASKYVWVMDPTTNKEERWLITGDMGICDKDGYFWFVGRDDDIINTSGYRCGPTEIEQACMKHGKVSNAAAIGKPDKLRNEIVKVFVLLNEHYDYHTMSQDELNTIKTQIQDLVKNLVGKHEYPREIEFVDSLPMTTTGKIQRGVLRTQEIQKMSQNN